MVSYHRAPGELGQERASAFPAEFSPSGEQSSDRRSRRLQALREAALAHRKSFLRLLGAALIIYGAIGLAASLYGYSLVRQAFASAREIGMVAPDEKGRALRGLQSISVILDDASKTSSNLTGSFRESQASLNTASAVATDVATAFRQVAQVASFQLFGVQPMAEMAQPFTDSSDRLDALAQDLTRTGAAIGANASDMRQLSTDFTRLRIEVDGLAQTVARLPSDPTTGEGAQRLETALSAMLVWIGLQGLGSIFAGLAILLLPLARRT